MPGRVKWVKKWGEEWPHSDGVDPAKGGYGFLTLDNDEDAFFLYTAIRKHPNYESPRELFLNMSEGDKVRCCVMDSKHGKKAELIEYLE